MLAQSVGGGGGNGGDVLTVSTIASIGIGGNAANGGDGGTVCVDNTGTNCDDVDGNGNRTGPAGQAATITTTGNYAAGLVAQSIGGGGGNGGSVRELQRPVLRGAADRRQGRRRRDRQGRDRSAERPGA